MNRDNDELMIKDLLKGINTPEYNMASEIEKNKVKKSPSFKRHRSGGSGNNFGL